ncbi:MAG: EAL domain-containing protein [Gammaproteobacteria bacterium]|jgi:diguanylate cyclase (GGDEF)-like protein|nr:EAL domain-containing protein [Gammaproteobacteria bacterium]
MLTRPTVSISLVLLLLISTSGVIYYVQRTLLEIEEALPIALSKQERDIRVLVYEMGRLVQDIEFARANTGLTSFGVVLRQTDTVELFLDKMSREYRFNDMLGISMIHARINPAVYDIKNWLTNGIFNFEPTSAHTLELVEERAKQAYEEAELLLQEVAQTAVDRLTVQAGRIKSFRSVMVITLAVLTLMSIGLVILGLRLQRIVIALKDSEEQIRYRANYDSLTQLPNRANFVEHLHEAITRDRRNNGLTALLFIDLDRFKTINDTLGHDYGDELIKQVADRIRRATRETDVVSRLGGDEFTVMLTNVSDEIHASIIAKHILARLSQPYMLDGHEVYSSASIGITLSPIDGRDVNTLLKNADMAMYEAKDQGRNTFRFFTSEMTDRARQFLEVDKDMRLALSQDELEVHYQPIYDTQNHKLVGVEALLRWQHPQRGLVLPTDFIRVAEETGLIEEIGQWVMRRACSEVREWLKHDLHPEFYLAVNISMRQFKGGFDKAQLQRILYETGFPADKLLLEITETLLMDHDTRTSEVLAEFREMGVRLAVDDFGTGYSALSYLREFPVSTLKIDRSFIRDITQSKSHLGLVQAIIAMARGLHLKTIAEGVETAEQGELLAELNCDMVQGYFYSKAVSASEVEKLLFSDRPHVVAVRSV